VAKTGSNASASYLESSKVAVIGAGYVGLVTSACLASFGHRVTCVDIDVEKVQSLKRGILPIFEPGLEDLVLDGLDSANLAFTTSYEEAIPGSDVVMVAVNTPPRLDGAAETTYVLEAVESVRRVASPGTVLAIKSTVPVGTCDHVDDIVAGSGLRVVSHPEFLRQGTAVKDFNRPDRIVVGSPDRDSGLRLLSLYESVEAPRVVCSRRSAELAKYVANASLAVRVSFINEVAGICDSVGADITTVSTIVGMDHRIGANYLRAGLGWGGSCLPKDVMALRSMATTNGDFTPILEAASSVNARQPFDAVEAVIAAGNLQEGARVGVLGLAFKPDTDDTRSSPALQIVQELLAAGMSVHAHDPAASPHVQRLYPQVTLCSNPYEVGHGADAVILATEWREYIDLDWFRFRKAMRGNVLFDGRCALDAERLMLAGFDFIAPGRRAVCNGGSSD
jgi:UDPglucose 6-dehydrogenase